MMNANTLDNKKRRKTLEGNKLKISLNPLKENPNMRFTISPIKINMNKKDSFLQINKSYNLKSNIKEKFSNKSLSKKTFSIINYSRKKTKNNSIRDYLNKSDVKKHSFELGPRNSSNIFNNYNFRIIKANLKNIRKNSTNNLFQNKATHRIDILEKNIKNAIHNMKKEIENKVGDSQIQDNITLINKMGKYTINPVNKNNKSPKKSLKNPFLFKFSPNALDLCCKQDTIKKRRSSVEINQMTKQKLFKRIKNKIHKDLYFKSINDISNENSLDEDSENNEKYKGSGFHPDSKFILIFDLLLIIANLYYFIYIPVKVANIKTLLAKESIIKEITNYFIDIIFLADFIITFFKGYYNFEMEIVRNIKKIIIHNLKDFFFFDLLEAIPIFFINRFIFKSNTIFYSYYLDERQKILAFLLFIKPFKIFKIIRKKKNKALEDFYTYLSENYYLEKLSKFIIYFLIFFLFIHLFICIHIFLSFQNYPNWIMHIDIINKTFFDKYIASFYFMVTTMTTVGYGDIVCVSFIERLYHIILLVIGTLLYTFLVSKIGNYLREDSYEKNKLSKDLNILENIRVTYPAMPFKLYSKIKSHLLSIFKKRKKTGISLLLNDVPDAIKNELLFKIYANVINGFTIFKNVKNSNFIYQILTSFIPIVSKKEEIIILEGDIIQNIIFVKDGRLSMEIAINLNDPYNSIKKYIESNFIGISREDELNNNISINNKNNSFLPKEKRNYNDLKQEIDNFLLDNQNSSFINNSNRISFDLGRMDFLKNEDEKANIEDYQTIKIMDIRKNEHFGDVHLFNEQPSPFTVKAKSRIADLLLLPKHEAIKLSKNYQNIWKRIQNKSYHNLVSIKKLTFKTLKQYYNTHIFSSNNKGNHLALNLDITKNSLSVSELGGINNNLKDKKMVNNENKSFTLKAPKNDKNLKESNIIKNYLINGNGQKSENSKDFDNDFKFTSFNSNSVSNLNHNSEKSPTDENRDKNNLLTKKEENIYSKEIIKSNYSDNFSFKDEVEDNKFSSLSTKKILKVKKSEKKYSKLNSSKEIQRIFNSNQNNGIKKYQSKNSFSNESLDNQTIKLVSTYTKKNFNESNNIISLEDMNKKFANKIKKIMKLRKKIKKLKELFKQQKKINKDLLELLMQQKSSKKLDLFDNLQKYQKNLNYSSSFSNNKQFSTILDSFYNEKNNLSFTKQNQEFEIKALKIISSDSFNIKSCYKNINSLTNGEMANNIKYRNFVEKLIKKTKIPRASKLLSSIFSQKNKKEENFQSEESKNEKNKEDDFIPGKIESSNEKLKYTNIFFKEQNGLSNKKSNYIKNTMESTESFPVDVEDIKVSQKKKKSKFLGLQKTKTFNYENSNFSIKEKENFKSNNKKEKTNIYKSKKSNNKAKKQHLNNDKKMHCLNDKFDNKKIKICDDSNSKLKINHDNNFEKENEKCYIY